MHKQDCIISFSNVCNLQICFNYWEIPSPLFLLREYRSPLIFFHVMLKSSTFVLKYLEGSVLFTAFFLDLSLTM